MLSQHDIGRVEDGVVRCDGDDGTCHDLMGAHGDLLFYVLKQRGSAVALVQRSGCSAHAADLISICLVCFGAGFGTVTFSTPLAISAEMSSTLTPEGSSTERENEP